MPPVLTPILTDAVSLRARVRDKTCAALTAAFPVDLRGRTLHVEDVRVHARDYSPVEQKAALMEGGSLSEPVKGTLVLKDADGKVLDRAKNFTLTHLPWFTERHTVEMDGNEYQVASMIRRRPGPYTSRSGSGDLRTTFNLSKGSNFDVTLDPAKAALHLTYDSTNIPLYPLLRALGTPHGEIAKHLGPQIADANRALYEGKEEGAVAKLYAKLVHPTQFNAALAHDLKVAEVAKKYAGTAMDAHVSTRTLGAAHTAVTPAALLDASKKLLAVHAGKAVVDDADSLEFKTFHSVDDFLAENVRITARAWAPKVRMALNGKATIREAVRPAPFAGAMRKWITTSALTAVPTGINAIELIDHSVKVTALGEGGIPSERAIPFEARLTHSSHFGVLDPIRTPECAGPDTEVLTAQGWKFWPDVRVTDELACRVEGRTEYHPPIRLIAKPYRGLMYGLDGSHIQYLVTPNHRVYGRHAGGVAWETRRADEVHGWDYEIPTGIDEDTHARGCRESFYTEPYDGLVYCAEVPGGLLYMRRHNCTPYWTGNSGHAGVDIRATISAHRDEEGNLYTPLRNVKTNAVEFVKAGDTYHHVIAFPGQVLKGEIDALHQGVAQKLDVSRVTHEQLHDSHTYSPTTTLIPGLRAIQGNRAIMGAKMQTQGLPLLAREAPLVQVKHPDGGSFEGFYGHMIVPVAPVGGTVRRIEGGYVWIEPHKAKRAHVEEFHAVKLADRPVTTTKKFGPLTFDIEIKQDAAPWGKPFLHDYGYLPGYTGPDGDSLDFWVGDDVHGVLCAVDTEEQDDDDKWHPADVKYVVGVRAADVPAVLAQIEQKPHTRVKHRRDFTDWDNLTASLEQYADDAKTAAPHEADLVKVPYSDHFPFPSKTQLHHTLEVKVGDKVEEGQRLCESNYTRGGILATGLNARVAYMPYYGLNSNDAVVISQGFAKRMTSEHVYREVFALGRDVDVDKAKHKVYFAAKYDARQYAALDADGVVKKGARINPHDLLVTGLAKATLSGTDAMLGRISKVLTKPYREAVLTWEHGVPGTVLDVVRTPGQIAILVETNEQMVVGDKLCYDGTTEVLTRRGWLPFHAVKYYDQVASLVDGTLRYVEPEALHAYPTGGRMYRIASQQIDLFVTEAHRMYVQLRDASSHQLYPATEIAGRRVSYKKDAAWKGHTPEFVTLPELEVKAGQGGVTTRVLPAVQIPAHTYAMLMGAFLSEGNLVDHPESGSYGIDICQIKEPNRQQLLNELTHLGVKFSEHGKKTKVRIYSKQLMEHCRQFGKAGDKFIPPFVFGWDRETLTVLFNWLMWGDGHSKHGMPISYTTVSRRLADDVQRLCLHIGKAANVQVKHLEGWQVVRGQRCWCQQSYDVRIVNTKLTPTVNHGHVKTQNTQEEGWVDAYDGPVYCVTVPSGVVYVRRNGKPVWSGNSGRYGNKGVIAKIIPDHEMLRTHDGHPVEVLMTSAGVVSRINPMQLHEALLGKIAVRTGKPILFDNASTKDVVEHVDALAKQHGVNGYEFLHDPVSKRTVRGGDGKGVFTGTSFIFKLFKSTDTNFAGHGVGPGYDVNEQPVKAGGDAGAKGLGKMEVDALVAHDARSLLADNANVRGQKSDAFWRAVQLGLPPPPPKSSFAYNKFTAMLDGAGVKVDKRGSKIHLLPLTDRDVLARSTGAVQNNKTVSAKTLKPETGGLFDPRLTGGAGGMLHAHIELPEPVPNPVFEEPVRRLLGMTGKRFDAVLAEKGGAHIRAELGKIDMVARTKELTGKLAALKGSELNDAVKQLKYLRALTAEGLHPRDYVITKVPVIPAAYRPITAQMNNPGQLMVADANKLYGHLLDVNHVVANPVLESDRPAHRRALYNAVGAVYGTEGVADEELAGQNVKGFLTQIGGQGTPKGGFFQRKLMKRQQDVSGRGTIVPDGNLHMNETGIPEQMLWQMFEKFLVARLIRKGYPALHAKELVDTKAPVARTALLEEVKERPVMVNRAPTLHRFGFVGTWAVPVQGKTIRISPFIETGLGADYDGDTVQIHAPITPGGIADVRRMMPSELLLADQKSGKLMSWPQHEAIIGATHALRAEATGAPVRTLTPEAARAGYRDGTLRLGDRVEVTAPKHAAEEPEDDGHVWTTEAALRLYPLDELAPPDGD